MSEETTTGAVAEAWDNLESANGDGLTNEESNKSPDTLWDDSVPEVENENKPSENKEEAEEGSEPEVEAQVKDDKGQEEEVKNETPRIYKAKFGDKVVEFPEDAILKVKANGKLVNVSFKELKEDYAGKVAWENKLRAVTETRDNLEREVGKFMAETQELGDYVKEMHESATKGNIFGALDAIARMVDISPSKFIEDFHNAFVGYYNKLADMTEEERRVHLLEEKNKSTEKTLTQRETQEKREKLINDINQRAYKLQDEHGISDDEMKLAYKTMSEAKEGKMEGVTPEHLVQLALEGRILDGLSSVIEENELKLDIKDIDYLYKVVKAEQEKSGKPFSDANFEGLVKAYVQYQQGDNQDQTVSDKAAEAVNRKVRGSNQTIKSSTPVKQEDGLDFSNASSTDALWEELDGNM